MAWEPSQSPNGLRSSGIGLDVYKRQVNEQALEWENEDGTLHEGQSEGWENEVLTMDFCSGTLQSFLHRNPIEASNASDERLFLLPFDEVKDIFEKTITLQVMTEDKNRLISVDGLSLIHILY